MTHNYVLPLPPVNEWGTPKTKMPNCPHCGDDELGLIDPPDRAVCYVCSAVVIRQPEFGVSITDIQVVCNQCPWQGRVAACEPRDDGELCCPQCLKVIVVRVP